MKLAYVEDNVKVDSFYNWYAPAPPRRRLSRLLVLTTLVFINKLSC